MKLVLGGYSFDIKDPSDPSGEENKQEMSEEYKELWLKVIDDFFSEALIPK